MKVFTMGILGIILSATAALGADCTERFSWLPNAEENITGYKIYFGSTKGGPYPNAVTVDAPTPDVDGRIRSEVPGLICDKIYYFVCAAYNSANSESDLTPQIEVLAGTPVSDDSGVTTKIFGYAVGADYIGAIQDTYIDINTENRVTSQRLTTYTWPDNNVANAIIMKVDLSQLPQGAQIQSASLQLYSNEAAGDSEYDISVHKIVKNNPELSASTGFSYNGTNDWTANTSRLDNIPMAQADISAAEDINRVDLSVGYKSWNVTNMVRSWVTVGDSNYGLLLNADTNASADSYRNFVSAEGTNVNQRPKLIVTYKVDNPNNPIPIIVNISHIK